MERRYTNIIPSGIGKEDAKMSMNKLKIHKNMVRRETSRNQIETMKVVSRNLDLRLTFTNS
jgi:hypothetical protein